MNKELLQKLALYPILPCTLAIAAIFLNNLFQPQLHWQLKLLENKAAFFQIKGLDNNITTLFNQPMAYSKKNSECPNYYGDVVYVHNKLLQDKILLELWIQINNIFSAILIFLAIIQAGEISMYLLLGKQKIDWGITFTIITLVAIAVIWLVGIFNPIHVGVLSCVAQPVKVEASLTNMSLDGLFYLFIGGIANLLAIIIMLKRCLPKPVFEQTTESAS